VRPARRRARHDRRARLLLPDRPGVPAGAPGTQDRARAAGRPRLDRAWFSAAEQTLRGRLSFLGEATALLTSSLELDRTLERLTELALLADWCAISMLVEETGEIEQVVVAHQDPERGGGPKRCADAPAPSGSTTSST
jgi:hypothetical protein